LLVSSRHGLSQVVGKDGHEPDMYGISAGLPDGLAATALTTGMARTVTLNPVTSPTLIYNMFTIDVPAGASLLKVVLRTSTPNVDVDLFVRFGQDVALSAGRPVADYTSEGPTGDETINIPSPQAGTYYIALGVFTPNVTITSTVTATVSGGPTGRQSDYNDNG